MAIALLIARAAERYVLEYRYIVVDDTRLTNHNAGRMVEHNTHAKRAAGVNIHSEHLSVATLDKGRERTP
jgi:hypothetical protein